jgi:hypothetical protein
VFSLFVIIKLYDIIDLKICLIIINVTTNLCFVFKVCYSLFIQKRLDGDLYEVLSPYFSPRRRSLSIRINILFNIIK